jgi:D-glucosaminate PTS system EIIB component
MDNIVLCRIDSRLIHGQVMTKWVNQSGAEKIVVIDDHFADDEFLKEVCLMSAPVGLDVVCYSKKEGIQEYAANGFGSDKVLLLLPGLAQMKNVYDQGIRISKIQVGGLGGAPNRKVVFQNITLDDADVEILRYFQQEGVEVIFQTIPEDMPQDLDNILKKYSTK